MHQFIWYNEDRSSDQPREEFPYLANVEDDDIIHGNYHQDKKTLPINSPCDESSPGKAAFSAYEALKTPFIGAVKSSIDYIRRFVNPDMFREPSTYLLPLVDFHLSCPKKPHAIFSLTLPLTFTDPSYLLWTDF
uniref:AlNc14C141G7248 protein n=1 Tax=Albugo laibachii Nc14 TaxID=890382 RepID=F0WL60_9STRA|nr:AlNc14C141G7248 [Albugo laibachii Nc14]|eukprot:CCA22021.1 AlNc14C141G7248 [Albugo laibachii Nc14]